jgi:hypothetical protein
MLGWVGAISLYIVVYAVDVLFNADSGNGDGFNRSLTEILECYSNRKYSKKEKIESLFELNNCHHDTKLASATPSAKPT